MILTWERSGLALFQSSYGVVATALVGLRFLRYTTVSAISIQSLLSSLNSAIIALTLSMIVRFARSATPFWSGLYGAVVSWIIPEPFRCIPIHFSYSPPPSVLSRLITFPLCFSTSGLYSLNFSNTSADDFFFKG